MATLCMVRKEVKSCILSVKINVAQWAWSTPGIVEPWTHHGYSGLKGNLYNFQCMRYKINYDRIDTENMTDIHLVVPHPMGHWRGTLFWLWSPFSVVFLSCRPCILASVHFLGFRKFSPKLLGLHVLTSYLVHITS